LNREQPATTLIRHILAYPGQTAAKCNGEVHTLGLAFRDVFD